MTVKRCFTDFTEVYRPGLSVKCHEIRAPDLLHEQPTTKWPSLLHAEGRECFCRCSSRGPPWGAAFLARFPASEATSPYARETPHGTRPLRIQAHAISYHNHEWPQICPWLTAPSA